MLLILLKYIIVLCLFDCMLLCYYVIMLLCYYMLTIFDYSNAILLKGAIQILYIICAIVCNAVTAPPFGASLLWKTSSERISAGQNDFEDAN